MKIKNTYQLQQMEDDFRKNDHFLLLMISFKNQRRIPTKNPLPGGQRELIYVKRVVLFVDTQKPLEIRKEKQNRAFTKTGLKCFTSVCAYKEKLFELARH
ncbi:MAG: hypothetical protein IPI65_08185 [Bacteroidetes bacterium]|nr:hypothetical protein [Bacteroidota bacterium]